MDTLLSLIREGVVEENYTIIPNGFIDNGWIAKAPSIASPILMGLCLTISKGLNKNEILNYLEEQYSDDNNYNYFVARHDFKDKNEQLEFWENRQRETKIKYSLESANYKYPVCLQDMLNLFVQWGIVIEEDETYDLIISPFPTPESLGIN
ncbi:MULTISPECIES: DUF6042 family protein [Paenibacillus]|uniref:DUF6042 family protein n=1 Tax=Paenibacillus TaxID=44249 RepID=UPI00078415CD|nr:MULTISPECIES: DUF6042 family protein [Paenibacillus]MBD8836854.1 hypothetical protein [Paenibacillus sp. CFBP 13594]MEC0125492.1 DUF6042 family protein [Paenibacillus pabuli]